MAATIGLLRCYRLVQAGVVLKQFSSSQPSKTQAIAIKLKSSLVPFKGNSFKLVAVTLGGISTAVIGYYTYKRLKYHFQKQKIGYFVGGFTSCLLMTSVFILVRRFSFASPEKIVEHVLPMLRANSEIRTIVGTDLKPGLFKAYSYFGGWTWRGIQEFGKPQESIIRRWSPLVYNPRTLQLMFQMNGTHSSAMVSLEVYKHTAKGIKFKSMAVDFVNGERLLLKGRQEDVIFKGVTRLR